jgi:HEAT repeat protein
MPTETETKVRQLLQSTHDAQWWHSQARTLQAEEAVPLLGAAMNSDSESEQARHQAATILGILGRKSAVPALMQALNASGPVLRARAAEALGRIGDVPHEAVSALLERLKDEDYFVRKCSAIALGQLKRPEALAALQHMRDTDSVDSNREAAQEAIKAIQGVR